LLLTGFSVLAPASVLTLSPDSPALAAMASVASVLLWLAGIVLIRHPLIDELDLARRKLAAALSH
jgi:predicted cobalt transporter CbtA